MVMIFTLVSAVQDRLSELLDFIKMEKERLELEKAEELERIEKVRLRFLLDILIFFLGLQCTEYRVFDAYLLTSRVIILAYILSTFQTLNLSLANITSVPLGQMMTLYLLVEYITIP